MNCALILSFCWPKKSKIIWKFSLSQYRCHITPIDVENCVKSALNSNHINQNFTVISIWGGGDYQLRSALAAKQIWVVVITIWGTLDSLPRSTKDAYISEITFLALVPWVKQTIHRKWNNLYERDPWSWVNRFGSFFNPITKAGHVPTFLNRSVPF